MAFTRSSLAKTASAVSAAVSIAAPLAAQAGPTTINATQLSIQVAPISISAERLGGQVSAQGVGLTVGAGAGLPTISNLGEITATANQMSVAANTTFNYQLTAISADTAPAAANASSAIIPATTFGSQQFTYSGGDGGTLGITAGTVSLSAGSNSGTTATAVFSTSMGTEFAESSVRRVASSTNRQSGYTTERQATTYGITGSGLEAVSNVGAVSDAAPGAIATITSATGGNVQSNVQFTRTETVKPGDASSNVVASSIDFAKPAFGSFTTTIGGSTAGAITTGNAAGINTMGVVGGGAGTDASLSVIQSLTAF
jgi:hypothetical protein